MDIDLRNQPKSIRCLNLYGACARLANVLETRRRLDTLGISHVTEDSSNFNLLLFDSFRLGQPGWNYTLLHLVLLPLLFRTSSISETIIFVVVIRSDLLPQNESHSTIWTFWHVISTGDRKRTVSNGTNCMEMSKLVMELCVFEVEYPP